MDTTGPTIRREDIERAIGEACRRGHAEVVDFVVTPGHRSADESCRGYDWLVEFAEPARAPAVFVQILDETLQVLNLPYRRSRAEAGMPAPRVLELPPGTFHHWKRDRRTCPNAQSLRITNDRTVADSLLAVVSARHQEPLVVGARDRDPART